MVLGIEPPAETSEVLGHHTSLPNVFMIGDTVVDVARMDLVVESALALADKLTK